MLLNISSSDTVKCGNSAVGRAQPCQGWGREFESRFPLKIKGLEKSKPFFVFVHLGGKNRSPQPCGKVLLYQLSKTKDKRQTKKMTKTGHSFVANL